MQKILALSLALLSLNCFATTTYFSDGTYATTYGDTTYFSNGTSATRYGSTTYFSDGSYATTY